MAITFTDTGTPLGDTGNTSPHSFASRTYTAGRTYGLFVLSTRSNPAAVPSSVSGTGITFSLVTQTATFNSGTQILSFWKATPSSTTTTAVSIAHAATTGTAAVCVELADANSTNLVPQSAVAAPVSTASITAALGSAVTSGNGVLTAVAYAANSATSTTPDSGWTALTGAAFNTPASGLRVAYSTTGEQNVVWTGTAVAKAALIAEVAAAKVLAADVTATTITAPSVALPVAYRLTAAAAAFALTGWAAALTEGGEAPVPTTITFTPPSAIVAVNGTAQLTATVLDQFGAPMAGEIVNIRSSDASIARVSEVSTWSDGVYLPSDTATRPYGRLFSGVDQFPGFTSRGVATLPSVWLDTTLPDFSGYTPTVVTNSAQFLTAYAACDAANGGVIQIAAGSSIECLSINVARTTSGWILVTHETAPASFPSPGTRITDTIGESITSVISGRSADGTPALTIGSGVHHLRFVGLKIIQHASSIGNTNLIETHADSSYLVFDRCYSRSATGKYLTRNFYWATHHGGIIDSWIEGAHTPGQECQSVQICETQGVCKFVNNLLGGIGENFFIGGGGFTNGDTVDTYYPKDIEFRRNHCYNTQSELDTYYYHKNKFELKVGWRIYIAENVFENQYPAVADQAWCMNIKTEDQSAGNIFIYNQTHDVTIYDNLFLNISNGIQITGTVSNGTLETERVDVDNIFLLAQNRSGTAPSGNFNHDSPFCVAAKYVTLTRITATGFSYWCTLWGQPDGLRYPSVRLEGVVSDSFVSSGVGMMIDLRGGTYSEVTSYRPEVLWRAIPEAATVTFRENGAYEGYWGGGAADWPQATVNGWGAQTVTRVATSNVSSPIAFVNADRAVFTTANYALEGTTPFKAASGDTLGCDYQSLMTRVAGVRADVPMGMT